MLKEDRPTRRKECTNARRFVVSGQWIVACWCLVFALLCYGYGCAETTELSAAVPTAAPIVMIDAKVTDTPANKAEAKSSQEQQPMPTVVPTAMPTATPRSVSLTTGKRLTEGSVYQPVLVVIGNAPQTRPQTGLMQADIIYEFAMDRTDNTTRLVAVFSDQYPQRVGPVQDARIYFTDLQREWDGMFIYNGYPDEPTYPAIDEGYIAIPVNYKTDNQQFFVQDRTVSDLPENAVFCALSEMTDALYGKYSPAAEQRFVFAPNHQYAGSKPIEKVGLPFMSSDVSRIEFIYKKEDNRLYRYEHNSKDALVESKTLTANADGLTFTSEPVSVQNLIVQYVKYTNASGTYRDAKLTGTGKCDYFINGQYVCGTWKRKSLSEPTTYLTKDGNPLILEPGNTWIALQTGLKDIKIRRLSTE
ncbi:MAG: DUF3048 C-terminal domain-containing protein [Clostridia bacterium]